MYEATLRERARRYRAAWATAIVDSETAARMEDQAVEMDEVAAALEAARNLVQLIEYDGGGYWATCDALSDALAVLDRR